MVLAVNVYLDVSCARSPNAGFLTEDQIGNPSRGIRVTESVLYDEHQVLPVSSLIDDFIGIKDMCLSVPSVVNRNGVQRTLPVPLTSYEAEALQSSGEAVRTVIERCGL